MPYGKQVLPQQIVVQIVASASCLQQQVDFCKVARLRNRPPAEGMKTGANQVNRYAQERFHKPDWLGWLPVSVEPLG